MPLIPDPPFPKTQGDNIRSKDWNDVVNEIVRLDTAKANRSGDRFTGPLTIDGAVGIGTAAPVGAVDIVGTTWNAHLRVTNVSNAGAGPSIYFKSAVREWAILATHGGASAGPGKLGVFDATANAYRLVIDADGRLGVRGVVSPSEDIHAPLRLRAGNLNVGSWPASSNYQMVGVATLDQTNGGNYALLQSAGGGDLGTTFVNSPRSVRLRIGNGDRMAVDPDATRCFVPFMTQQAHTIKIGMPAGPYGNDGIRGEPNLWLDAAGTVLIKQGFQSRGMDVAERFPVAEAVRAGEVVCYDAAAGAVRPCGRAGDPTAVGIVSEAPAFILGMEEAEAPIALCGRVPCYVDADVAPIVPGDLLVASATRGHAQKLGAGEAAGGRVIGKALEPLASGQGRILAFVLAA